MKLKQHQKYLEELLANENERMQKLHQIVAEAVQEEELLTEHLTEDSDRPKLKLGDRISYHVSKFIGSWKFIISFCLIFGTWIVLNSMDRFWNIHFDPFPYDVIKLTLSLIAAVQAPLIMMNQNRQATKERRRNENQYLINLKAEIEVRHLHQKMDLLMKEQIKNLLEVQKVQLDLIEKLYVKLDKLKDNK